MRRTSLGTQPDEILELDPELRPHLNALGLKSAQEYVDWCARNGFSTRLNKHWRERCRERYFAALPKVQRHLTRTKEQKRNPGGILYRIFDGELDAAEIQRPELQLNSTFAGVD
jgi:hypothetical protein